MIENISLFFIKRCKCTCTVTERTIFGIVSSCAGIILNILMFILKLTASAFSGSVAAAVDAVHNLTDSASSLVTLLGFIFCAQPETERYPMGKGRIEYIAGFIVSVVLISAGTELAKTSVSRIINPATVTFSGVSLIMLIISFAVKLYMAFYSSRIAKKISSEALKAAAADCLCDSFSTLIALAAMAILPFTSFNADAWGGLAVSVFILFTGLKSAKETLNLLAGENADKATLCEVRRIFEANFAEAEICRIVLHDYGPCNRIIDVSVTVCTACDAAYIAKKQTELSRLLKASAGVHLALTLTE